MQILVIFGSSREGREGEKAAKWVANYVSKQEGVSVDYADLRELGLSRFNEAGTVDDLEKNESYSDAKALQWSKRVAKADGFIMVTPEYNHGVPAVLKDAIDYVWNGWHYKPISIVSYSGGPWGGTRAAEQLRLIMIGTKSFPLYQATHIPFIWKAFDENNHPTDETSQKSLEKTVAELLMVTGKLSK